MTPNQMKKAITDDLEGFLDRFFEDEAVVCSEFDPVDSRVTFTIAVPTREAILGRVLQTLDGLAES